MLGMMDCWGMTDLGQVRERNEDQFLIADLLKSVIIHHTSLSYDDDTELHGASQAKLFMVADGVAGNAAGDRASRLAVESVVQYLLNMMHWLFRVELDREDTFVGDLRAALEWSQERIQHAAQAVPERQGMGTTITVAYLVWPMAYLVHVGDSRAYLHRDGKLLQLTHDQTIAQGLADAGVIGEDQIERHPFGHMLSSFLGCNPHELQPATFKAELRLGDKLLLCTDGLTRHVSESQIAELLGKQLPAKQSCERLVQASNDAGGADNTTVVLACFTDHRGDGDLAEAAEAELPQQQLGQPAV